MLDRTLTPDLQRGMMQNARRNEVQELRFRRGGPVKAVYSWGEAVLPVDGRPYPVTDRLLRELLDRATGFSPNALRLEESGLYLPLEDGCRMGLCGEALIRDGKLTGLKKIGSAAIRIARERRGIAEDTARRITGNGRVESGLIVSPPGRGKTTFLRDLVRAVSERGFRVSVADERRELSGCGEGGKQMDLGPCTDVLTGCPKIQAIPLLIRVMNPQILAVDELSGPEEVHLAADAARRGVAVFATVHADGVGALSRSARGRMLLRDGVFRWGVTIRAPGIYEWERLDGYVEGAGGLPGDAGVRHVRMGGAAGNAPDAPDQAAAPSGAGVDAGRDGDRDAHRGGAV